MNKVFLKLLATDFRRGVTFLAFGKSMKECGLQLNMQQETRGNMIRFFCVSARRFGGKFVMSEKRRGV
jgi:hypothetical protein